MIWSRDPIGMVGSETQARGRPSDNTLIAGLIIENTSRERAATGRLYWVAGNSFWNHLVSPFLRQSFTHVASFRRYLIYRLVGYVCQLNSWSGGIAWCYTGRNCSR
jgi:hypothetical protein